MNSIKNILNTLVRPVSVLAVFSASVSASVVVIDGAEKIEDTYLRGDNSAGGTTPVNNYGAATLLQVGRLPDGSGQQNLANSLMRFDVSELAGLSVTGATLRLFNSNHQNQTEDVTVNIFELTEANGDWVEGDGNNTVVSGTSDWRFKIQNTGAWAGGTNGAGVAGVDYVNTLVGSALVVDGAAQYIEFALDAGVIQNWIDNPGENYGIILTYASGTGEGAMAYFNSTNASGNTPQLVITAIPETSTMMLVCLAALVLFAQQARKRLGRKS